MKKRILLILILAGLFVLPVQAGLNPELIALTYSRPYGSQYVNTNVYLAGSAITFTNCKVCLSGALSYSFYTNAMTNIVWVTNDTRIAQDLTGLGINLKLGNSKTNITAIATTDVATNGTFFVTISVPTYDQLQLSDTSPGNLRIQCTVTNATGLSYVYRGDQYLYIRTPMKY